MEKLFDKIKLAQLYTLCRIIVETEVRNTSNLRRRYLEQAFSFDETVLLLERLKIVTRQNDKLGLSKRFSTATRSFEEFKKQFLVSLFSARGEISVELQRFLRNFEMRGQDIVFRASELEKLTFSNTRNLLLELEFILTGEDNTSYLVNRDFTELFLKEITTGRLSLRDFRKKQAKKELIGLNAEKAVIKFEIERLNKINILPREVEHISQKNVLAGYDIKRFENYLDDNLERVDRFIEVKAVSPKDYKFFWSRNEIEIAKVFGEKYFLYLLPVISNKKFDLSNLQIIRNPFIEIYGSDEWEKREESVCISRASKS